MVPGWDRSRNARVRLCEWATGVAALQLPSWRDRNKKKKKKKKKEGVSARVTFSGRNRQQKVLISDSTVNISTIKYVDVIERHTASQEAGHARFFFTEREGRKTSDARVAIPAVLGAGLGHSR